MVAAAACKCLRTCRPGAAAVLVQAWPSADARAVQPRPQVGIALEARRLDQLEAAVERSPDRVATLTYALDVTQRLVVSRQFRNQVRGQQRRARPSGLRQRRCRWRHVGASWPLASWLVLTLALRPRQVLRLLIRLYEGVSQPDHPTICQCLMFLDDSAEVGGRRAVQGARLPRLWRQRQWMQRRLQHAAAIAGML